VSTDLAARKRARLVRLTVLVAVLLVSTGIGLAHQYLAVPKLVSVDALCPFGGLESLASLFASGAFLKRIAAGSVVLLVASVGLALVVGRAFCGQFCPLGALQELFGKVRGVFKMRRREMPTSLDAPARLLKYGVLGIFLLWTWRAGTLVIRPYDPWVAFHHLTSAEVLTEFGIGALVLGVSLAGSIVYDRFFCKYACPMGAFLALTSRFAPVRVRRAEDVCIDCGACDKACPMNVSVADADVVTASECIACGECVTACPKPGALSVGDGSNRVLKPVALTGAVLATFLAVVGVSTLVGTMAFTTPTLAQEAVAAEERGEAFDTASIKGSSTAQDVSQATGISEQEFIARFGMSEADTIRPLKETKEIYGFTMNDVRVFVAERLGLPAPEPEDH